VGVGVLQRIKIVRQSLGYGKENGPDKLMFARERAVAPEANVRKRICAEVEERVILVHLNAYVFSICYEENTEFFLTDK
jgi:hypothetical protein